MHMIIMTRVFDTVPTTSQMEYPCLLSIFVRVHLYISHTMDNIG